MNRVKLTSAAFFMLLVYVSAAFGKVLVIVDDQYTQWDHSGHRIERYQQDVAAKEGKSVTIIQFTNNWSLSSIQQCNRLWQVLCNNYRASLKTSDPIEGAVFVGNLPVPIFYSMGQWIVVDYFYMDFWDSRTRECYTSWNQVWDTCITNETIFKTTQQTTAITDTVFDRYRYQGDGKAEIWVSRVYATTIENLRPTGASWGEFLEEYEIIDRYFDRVYERMNLRAKVPSRAFSMGHISDWYPDSLSALTDLENMLGFNQLGVSGVHYFVNPHNNPAKYQALLQAGPAGAVTYGAFQGVRFPVNEFYRDTWDANFAGDSRGYEFAGIFEHSTENEHVFNMVSSAGNCLNGRFRTTTVAPAWKRVESGGFAGGSFYWCQERDEKPVWGERGYKDRDRYMRTCRWNAYVTKPGAYKLYLWYEARPENEAFSHANLFVNDRLVSAFPVNQQIHADVKAGTQWEMLRSIELTGDSNKISLRLHPSFNNPDPEILPDRTIADALLLQRVSDGDSIIVDNDDRDFMMKWFECEQWKERSYFSMIDDGGPSKVPFFIIQGCNVFSFNYTNCLGLLYAMGYEGLVSVGTSSPGWFSCTYETLSQCLGKGKSFGAAYLDMVNEHFTDYYNTYELIGVGTLRASPYKPYIDARTKTVTGTIGDSMEKGKKITLFVRDTTKFKRVVVSPNAAIAVNTGSIIRLLPEFRSLRGSQLELKIDPRLRQE
ncbi:MAG: hypothetical protein JW795_04020 [Chitinivibrionales bacterium]|nr:hypothetical protein [Chitinivibrionales bacterium]